MSEEVAPLWALARQVRTVTSCEINACRPAAVQLGGDIGRQRREEGAGSIGARVVVGSKPLARRVGSTPDTYGKRPHPHVLRGPRADPREPEEAPLDLVRLEPAVEVQPAQDGARHPDEGSTATGRHRERLAVVLAHVG